MGLRTLTRYPELLPGLAAVAMFVVLAASAAGSEPTTWYPAALFALGLLVVVALVELRVGGLRLSRATAIALILLAAFTAWSFLSIAWAGVEGEAWDGANRTAFYLTVFAAFAIPVWRPISAAVVLGAWALGIAALAVGVLVELGSSADPSLSLIDSRFVEPTGYGNANAALMLAAFWPCLFFASRRQTPWPLRPLFLAAAGLLAETALMAQSRGSAVALPIVAILYLAIVPGRVRSALVLAPVAIATVLAAPSVLDLYDSASSGGDIGAAADTATGAVWASALALLAIGTALALIDRRIEVPERYRAASGRALAAVGAVAAIAGTIAALIAIGNPVNWADERWQDFKSGYDRSENATSRFDTGLGSNRYDFWRVAMSEAADSPLVGIGTENFAVEYLQDRRSDEEPHHPHSLEVQVASQTGIVGSALFVGFLVCALAATPATWRRAADPWYHGIVATSVVVFAYWFVHGSADWFWPLPALTAPALAWLALAGRIERQPTSRSPSSAEATAPPREPDRAPRSPIARALAFGAAGVVALALVISYALPWTAARDVRAAGRGWTSDSEAAFERLDRAADLNPLSEEPYLVGGAIAVRLEDNERAAALFAAALERNPSSWYAALELGALRAVGGDRSGALELLRRAAALNPRDPVVTETLARAAAGRSISLQALDRELLARVCANLGRTEATRFCPQSPANNR